MAGGASKACNLEDEDGVVGGLKGAKAAACLATRPTPMRTKQELAVSFMVFSV